MVYSNNHGVVLIIQCKTHYCNSFAHFFSKLNCRHPEAPKRPQFAHLLQTLSRPEYELLNIPTEEVDKGLPQATILGAPLEVSKNIFTDLQNLYVSS